MSLETQIEPPKTGPEEARANVAAQTVGVFDSGVGGFTVAREVLRRRPDLNLVYFGDSLNMPYGGRSPEQLARFATNSIHFLIEQGVNILAVGCNASNSILGQSELRSFGIRVFDLVSSTVDSLRAADQPPERLALVATVASINSGYWQRKLHEAFPSIDVLEIPAPAFVPLVESETASEQSIRNEVEAALEPCLKQGFNTLLHGCTHFPLLEHYMVEYSPEFTFIDPAVCLAQNLAAHLSSPAAGAASGWRRMYSSLPGQTFYSTAHKALGFRVESLTKMYIVNPYED
jgi:glutamate racemase